MLEREPLFLSVAFVAIFIYFLLSLPKFWEIFLRKSASYKFFSVALFFLDISPVMLLFYAISSYDLEVSQLILLAILAGILFKINEKFLKIIGIIVSNAMLVAPIWLMWWMPRARAEYAIIIFIAHILIAAFCIFATIICEIYFSPPTKN